MSTKNQSNQEWDIIVKPKSSSLHLNLREVWAYKDLIALMVKRDITSVYKQTLLGPLWMFIQPIFITIIYTFTFSSSAGLSTDGIPPILFYLIGQTFWVYFSDCLTKTSNTFISNASVFGKVYFPRLVMPFSVIISGLVKLGLQISLLAVVYLFYYFKTDQVQPQFAYFILLPLFIIIMGVFSLSLGIIFSSFTTKYRDFTFLLGFAIQLLMFLSFVTFPASMFSPLNQTILMCNPIASSMEAIKFILTGHGVFSVYFIIMAIITTMVLFFFSIIIFNKTEKSFMDTV
ncbi:MAG: ABC transporter permease [Bacteroidota bacterium]|nr:ABC transporter permease [Bacteroidota bacterium]MDP3146178.1 ABC transporter permease [Bacteroidota bacterium]MDP3556669.1 ABC transporter permease [Bacteroidota bacterium]